MKHAHRSTTGWLFAAVMIALLTVPGAARAGTEENQANKLYLQGQYAEAAQRFIDLYVDTGDPIFLRNLARCYYQMKMPNEAISRFREYLAKSRRSATKDRDEVEKYIQEMEELRRMQASGKSREHGDATQPQPSESELTKASLTDAQTAGPIANVASSPVALAAAPAPAVVTAVPPPYASPSTTTPLEPQAIPGKGEASAANRPQTGLLLLPYLGVQSFQGSGSGGMGVGARLGSLIGGHISSRYSLNGEITIDILNPDAPSGVDVSAVEVDLAFSPLVHLPVGNSNFELVFGPKLGYWAGDVAATSGSLKATASEHGWLLGVNAGLFASLSRGTALGGLLSFGARNASEVCVTAPGESEQCATTNLGDAAKVLGVTAALMF